MKEITSVEELKQVLKEQQESIAHIKFLLEQLQELWNFNLSAKEVFTNLDVREETI